MLKNSNASEADLTLRLYQVSKQSVGSISRIRGNARIRQIARLIEITDLSANPRFSKMSNITQDIIDTLETTPDLFWVMSKGIVVSASSYRDLDGDRFEFSFEDEQFEGVIDGGHNLLGIGYFILRLALEEYGNDDDLKALNKAKVWGQFKSLYMAKLDLVKKLISEHSDAPELSIQVDIEIIVPTSPKNELDRSEFDASIPRISGSRNNNASVRPEARSNKQGLFEHLKNNMPSAIANRVEWKTNQEGGKIKVADVIALAWVPLSKLSLEIKDEEGIIQAPNPTSIYSSKGELVTRFDRYMSSNMVTTDDIPAELKSNPVRSALELAGELPELYDLITETLPASYNDRGGRFGAIAAVAKMNTKKGKKLSKYTEKGVEYRCPEGFITPLVYGLKALMQLDGNGEISWATSPKDFIKDHLPEIVEGYMGVIKENNMDPQKVGKSSLAYDYVIKSFELALKSAK
jgi:hypothetical protein